jgi:hypothetical protein
MNKDYTTVGSIIRGSRWPPADLVLTIILTKTDNWGEAAEGWLWEFLLSRHQMGGTPDISTTAVTAIVESNVITLTFRLHPEDTELIPAFLDRVHVDLRSTDEANVITYYDCVAGTADVRSGAGEG